VGALQDALAPSEGIRVARWQPQTIRAETQGWKDRPPTGNAWLEHVNFVPADASSLEPMSVCGGCTRSSRDAAQRGALILHR